MGSREPRCYPEDQPSLKGRNSEVFDQGYFDDYQEKLLAINPSISDMRPRSSKYAEMSFRNPDFCYGVIGSILFHLFIGFLLMYDASSPRAVLLNENKNIVEAINGNIFICFNDSIITPPIAEGCLNGVMRKQIIKIINEIENLELIERPISPFELQKADEIFYSNVIIGIQNITTYRKKEFSNKISKLILDNLNSKIVN